MKFSAFAPLFCLLFALAARAADPPVKDGLILNLDAAAQPAARQAASLPPVSHARPLDRWLSTAPGGTGALQMLPDNRPVYHRGEDEAFVRFDGKDDFLTVSGAGRLTPEITVFVLAAPRGNPGNFSALFSTAEAGRNDYTSGLNLDFGPASTKQLSVLNVESAGCAGFHDLLEPGRELAADLPFENFHVFTVRSKIGKDGNELFLDGTPLVPRTRLESNIGLDVMAIGSRFLSHDPAQEPYAQSFLHGDITAVLVYNRALSDRERLEVEQALFARTPALNAMASGAGGHALEVLRDPPPVQMLAPGFQVDELPLKLTNLNNIRYRHDGKLVALGYDGRLHLLSDTDGDGLEDKSEIFWDKSVLRGPVGIALLPKDDPRGDGVFVASKGKISLILDRDRDGKADEEIIASTGWTEIFNNVDAVGLAVDPKDGSLYFCLGVENFANAYLVDPATGKAGFRITSDRSSIQKVSADFKRRETVCTGVRFACALAFNKEGDLFATEQEGATWLPNGNPLDELLHIQPGRHYGFPPRHPKHLPHVIDEPPVAEYGPQHQSTVGMVFNESVNGGPAFGPEAWHGDAIVCGEARGKLYRTKLVKTAQGYVSQTHLFACLGLLTVDACVTPQGGLVVACHTGPPDWGTGPAGEGRLFKIRYAKPELPQPVQAWAAGPDEFRIAFDKPLDPREWAGMKDKVRIEAGRYVAAGDRYEVIRPGYQVVRDQMAAPRRWVEVQSLSLTNDRRTLVLRVPVQTEALTCAITLPLPESWQIKTGMKQNPEMDAALTLNGIQAELQSGGKSPLRVVLPHPSPAVAKAFTAGSADHEAFFAALETGGADSKLTVSGKADVSNIFQPATQPGADPGWDVSKDAFAQRTMTLRQDFTAAAPPEITLPDTPDKVKPLNVSFAGPLQLTGSGLSFALDDRARPVGLHRLFTPWASLTPAAKDAGKAPDRTDVKGHWLRGKRLFFGAATCFTCHSIRGEGIAFGPDLTNLIHRDRDSVIHDILQPSATINPDQTGSLVTFTDGTTQSGVLRSLTDEKLVLALPAGAVVERARKEVKSVETLPHSLMPEGFGQVLSETDREDLLTFLLTNPLTPAPLSRLDPAPPPPRSLAEIAPHLPAPPEPDTAAPAPLRLLLSAGEKDHGTDEHDYPLWLERWSKLLALAENVTVTTCQGFPSREQLAAADVTVFYSKNEGFNPASAILLDEYQNRGGGLVYLHWAVEGGPHGDALAERIGLASGNGMIAYRHGPLELVFTDSQHPISRGFNRLPMVDESYWKMRGDPKRLNILANSTEDNAPQPQLWTLERGKGRVFGCIPGHYTWTFDDPLYRLLVLRGIAWTGSQENTDRLAELMTIGARLAP